MPRRTVTVTRFWANSRRRRDEWQDLSRLGGTIDVLHYSYAFFRDLPKSDLVDHTKERYVSIESLKPVGRTVQIELSAGHFGEVGSTRIVTTGATTHNRSANESATAAVRAYLVLPTGATSMLLFLEHSNNASAAWVLIEPLRQWLRARFPDWTWNTEGVIEPGAWIEGAELTEVSAVMHNHSPDIADKGVPKVVGNLRYELRPTRQNKILPRALFDSLVSGKVQKGALFGVSDEDIEEVYVQMTKDGRRKRFSLGDTSAPLGRWVLAEPGEAEPSNADAIDFFVYLAPELFDAIGDDWQDQDRYGNWTAAQSSLSSAVL